MDDTTLLGDKTVRRIGFGAMQLAGPGVMGPPRDPDTAKAVLRRAVELGVDHVDTAQFYGPDVVNDLIREALHPYPEQLKLVTKVGARRDASGAWLPAQTPQELVQGVEDNLRSLRVERMDLVNLRLLDGPAPVALEDQLAALEDLRTQGKLDLVGLSNASGAQVEQALSLARVACVQNAYNILDRADQPVLDLCRTRSIAYVPFFPLGSAFTGGPAALAQDPVLADVARANGATPAQVALAWLLTRDARLLLIPGTASLAHLEENLAAADLRLDAADLERLDGVRQVERAHP